VIIDGRLRVPAEAKVFRQRSSAPTILVTTAGNRARAERLYGSHRGGQPTVEIVGAKSAAGKIDLRDLTREFGRRGWSKILLEGGARLAGAALAAGIVDRVAFFLAPRILGGGLPAIDGLMSRSIRSSIRLGELHVAEVGPDLLIEAEIAHPPSRKR
jgi:diaminohydroxyphosphoribosylaminopyrimidine deaminase/5-amino-6-(5-phosphoribosylamino)uracil reductase